MFVSKIDFRFCIFDTFCMKFLVMFLFVAYYSFFSAQSYGMKCGKISKIAAERADQTITKLRENETAVITASGEFTKNITYHWDSTNGVIKGKGSRVNYFPGKSISKASISLTTFKNGRKCSKKTKSFQVLPALPRILIEKFDAKRRSDNFLGFEGKIENLRKMRSLSVGIFRHDDQFYKYIGDTKIDKQGRFKTEVRINAQSDRITFVLYDPKSYHHKCLKKSDKGCRGTGDFYFKTKKIVPFKVDGEKVFHYTSRYIMGDAQRENKQIQFLLNIFSKTQIPKTKKHPVEIPGRGRLIRSYLESDQVFLYDQALAIIALVHAGEQDAAKEILNALWMLQINDGTERNGSWYFSYNPDGTTIYPLEIGDRRIAGAIAWVFLAINQYILKFKDKTYLKMALNTANFLEKEMSPIHFNSVKSRAVKFNQVDIKSSKWDERVVTSVEHNLDSYAGFLLFQQITGNTKYGKLAREIRLYLESLWTGKSFYPGYNMATKEPNKSVRYLDTQSWGILSLGLKGDKGQDFSLGLQENCRLYFEPAGHFEKVAGVPGFYDIRYPKKEVPNLSGLRGPWG